MRLNIWHRAIVALTLVLISCIFFQNIAPYRDRLADTECVDEDVDIGLQKGVLAFELKGPAKTRAVHKNKPGPGAGKVALDTYSRGGISVDLRLAKGWVGNISHQKVQG